VDTRAKVIVAVGFVVLVGLAAVGGVAYLGADRGWEEQAIGEMGLSADRRTLSVRAEEYQSRSCTEGRVKITEGEERWTVTLESRRFEDFCTAEGCIGNENRGSRPARQLDPGESIPCPLVEIVLDRAVPEGVELVPA
jgi:hypothetical protein